MTLGVAALAFIAGVTLIPFVPKGFIPKLDRGEFNVFYTTPLPELPSVAELAVGEGEFFEGEGFREGIPYDEIPDDAFANYDEYGKGFPGESLPADEFPESVSIDPLQVILEDSREVGEKIESIVRSLPEVESVLTTVGIRGEPNRGKLYLKLKDDRQLDTSQVQGQVRENLPLLDNVTVSVEDIQFVELDSTQPLQIALLGDDDKALAQGAQDLKTRLEELPGYEDVTATGQGSDGEDGVEIQRLNRQRVAYVRANLGEGLALGDATDGVLEIAPEVLPAGVRLQLGGDSEVSSDVFGSFAVTLTLSVTCMLLVLVLPFGRLLEPMVVGLSLPLAIVGAMMALLLTQSDFGMSSLIGFIFLLGLLDKNALLLMDYVNQLRRGGLSRTEAILKTGLVRLRPILMTTASTVLGMIPIALGLGAGAELRQPMAVAIIGGLVTSSLLSLIVVPVLYTSMEDVWGKLVKTIKN